MVSNTSCQVEKQNGSVEGNVCERRFVPAVDVFETPHDFVLTADVPGAVADQIDVRFEEGELTIHAPVFPRKKADLPLMLEEYAVGDYYRSFRLGKQIDPTKIAARYAEGVLRLTLPKVEAARPRKIAVNPG